MKPLSFLCCVVALLLASCAEPPGDSGTADAIVPPPDCKDACAAGFRWATEEQLTNKAKCRGEGDFGEGCR